MESQLDQPFQRSLHCSGADPEGVVGGGGTHTGGGAQLFWVHLLSQYLYRWGGGHASPRQHYDNSPTITVIDNILYNYIKNTLRKRTLGESL